MKLMSWTSIYAEETQVTEVKRRCCGVAGRKSGVKHVPDLIVGGSL